MMRTLGLLGGIIVFSSSAYAADLPDILEEGEPVAENEIFAAFGGSIGVLSLENTPNYSLIGTDRSPKRKTRQAYGLHGAIGTNFGQLGSSPLFIQWAGSYVVSNDSSSSTQSYGNDDFFVISSRALPGVDGDLEASVSVTDALSTTDVTVTDASGTSATINRLDTSPIGGGISSSQDLSPTTSDNGAAYTAGEAIGDSGEASAYLAAYDQNGFVFMGLGDIDGTTVKSSIDDDYMTTFHRVMVKAPIDLGNGWSVSPSVGPTYRYINRSTTTETSIDIHESIGPSDRFAPFSLTNEDDLTTHYAGAQLGLGISGAVAEGWTLGLSLEAGLSEYWAKHKGATKLDFADRTDINLPSVSDSASGWTPNASLEATLSHMFENGAVLSFGVGGSYLGDVPHLKVSQVGTVATSSNGNTQANIDTSSGDLSYVTSIDTAAMWEANLSASLIFRF